MNEPNEDAYLSRRQFLGASAGAVALSLVEGSSAPAGGQNKLGTHHIPADKNLDQAWVKSLFVRGETRVYRSEELTCVGMPIGGICAGQLYLRGDGTLAEWAIFNQAHFTGYGDTCYRTYTPPAPLEQGFRLTVESPGKEQQSRALNRQDFPQVEFIGEYPLGKVRYALGADDTFPVEVSLEAFSPFVPLNARESATPGTILRFRLHNRTDQPLKAGLTGWLQNQIGEQHLGRIRGRGRNSIVRDANLTGLLLAVEEIAGPKVETPQEPEVFADFESGSYGNWKKTGTAFGDQPARGTLPHQQKVSGYDGKYLVNSFAGGDDSTGTLTSPEFMIHRPYINFKIGGGNFPGKTCINLLIDGRVVRTATGKNDEKLQADYWEVGDLQGKKARIEIVDQQKGGWGHINVDDIQFADTPPKDLRLRLLRDQPDIGTLALSVLDGKAAGLADRSQTSNESYSAAASFPLGSRRTGSLSIERSLAPGSVEEVVFLITWHFAQGEHGRMYGNWFGDALAVARYLRDNIDQVTKLTHLFHDTYYDSTLPHWFLDRILMPISTLATDTVQWWRNGRFWAWEGVGCCNGTCTHVWNYAQGMAHLFPELERSARVMQDLGPAFDPRTGRVGFRGEDPGSPYAADGQCGTVLKCYREHLLSRDDTFLKENWPRIKKVMEYEIGRDGNGDGVIEDKQWNTFDLDFVGPNTFVGALYLAALKAAAQMADSQGDKAFAERCREIADAGGRWSGEHLWNGEYFVQRIPEGAPTKFQYGDGCLADQLFGQNWANQLVLGNLYPTTKVRAALAAVYRYNWAPDVAAQNQAYPPQRWFVRPGEAGLFTCTWPKGGRMLEPVLYRDEVWTGTEYQMASHLLYEGLLREGLSIVRGIHDRYDGRHHNPWNEVECGDHYARALASWGCLLALSGFSYDGPAGRLGFAPRLQAEDFKAFFTAAEGWGSIRQTCSGKSQTDTVELRYGSLRLTELKLKTADTEPLSEVTVSVAEKRLPASAESSGGIRSIRLAKPLVLQAGETLMVNLQVGLK
jgi:uncharacterized protein (DUF608 family)